MSYTVLIAVPCTGHGSLDSKVPPKAAQGLYHKLSKSRRPGVEKMKVYARSGHNLAEQAPEVRQDVLEWITDVLKLADSDL